MKTKELDTSLEKVTTIHTQEGFRVAQNLPVEGLPFDFVVGKSLPLAVNGDASKLSSEAYNKIHKLFGTSPIYFAKAVLLAWVVIFGSIYFAVVMHSLWISLVVICIVASRQNILGLLIHEQSHFLGSQTKLGDALANLFAGWPLIILSVEGYAKIHVAHHKYFFTEKDPDFLRKNGADWTFPLTPNIYFGFVLLISLV